MYNNYLKTSAWQRPHDWQTICVIETENGDFIPMEYDTCGNDYDEDVFYPIGKGRIYAVGGVVQLDWETSEIYSFWKYK